jgi:hypothetical protein
VRGDQKSLDCPLRQVGLDLAQSLQPWRSLAAFQEIADALNGAQEAQNCSVAPTASRASGSTARTLSFPLPALGSPVYFVDPTPAGSDATGTGAIGAPFSTLEHALAAVRASRARAGIMDASNAPVFTLVLRAGTFYLPRTLQLSAADSRVTFQAYPGEMPFISGAVPINAEWTAVTPPSRAAYEYRPGALGDGFDVAAPASYTVAQAQAFCDSLPLCAGFSYPSNNANPSSPVTVSFKYNVFYGATGSDSTYVKNVGYAAGAQAALYSAPVADILGADADVDSLRLNSVRAIRARYPNSPTAELMGAMQILAKSWTKQTDPKVADYTFAPATPTRAGFANDNKGVPYFSQFRLGVGGPCASRFSPQAA